MHFCSILWCTNEKYFLIFVYNIDQMDIERASLVLFCCFMGKKMQLIALKRCFKALSFLSFLCLKEKYSLPVLAQYYIEYSWLDSN